MTDTAIKRRRQLTVRMTDYESRRLDALRRALVPPGSRPRPAGPVMVEAMVRAAHAAERAGEGASDEKKTPGAK